MKKTERNPIFMTGEISNLSPYVMSQVENEYWHHRSRWMAKRLDRINRFFFDLSGKTFTPIILTNTKRGALDAIVANVTTPNELVLVQKQGSWNEVIGAFGLRSKQLDKFLKGNSKEDPRLVCLDDINGKGEILITHALVQNIRKKYPSTIIVANLSITFAADQLNIRSLGLDGFVVVPEKALGGIPGLSVVALNKKFIDAIQETRNTSNVFPYALDLLRYLESWKKNDTPYSPDISASVALNASIELIEKSGGVKKHIQRHVQWAEAIRSYGKKLGLQVVSTSNKQTNAFTIFKLPKNLDALTFVNRLDSKHNIKIHLEDKGKKLIRIGHTGFLTANNIERLLSALSDVSSKKTTSPTVSRTLHNTWHDMPQTQSLLHTSFKIPSEEFYRQTLKKGQGRNKKEQEVLKRSAELIFNSAIKRSSRRFAKNRRIGFIGAGNTVRETVALIQKMGVNDIAVYSPSLANQLRKGTRGNKNNHKTVSYWTSRGIHVARTNKEIFLKSHTVVLLPTLYAKNSIKLFNKNAEYVNEHIINNKLLTEIRDSGKMDVLINASAREELIDRNALKKHLDQGWLLFSSDELPNKHDPMWDAENTYMTGHIGGSCSETKRSVAKNTRIILQSVIKQIAHGGKLISHTKTYAINVVNRDFLKNPCANTLSDTTKEIRILLSDEFDIKTLDFPTLEKRLGTKICVTDISKERKNEKSLILQLKKHKPHILMIRTGTTVSYKVAHAIKGIPNFVCVIRPGVGIDNIYAGIATLNKAGILVINEPYGNSRSVGEMTSHLIMDTVHKIILTPGPSKYNREVFGAINNYAYPSSKEFLRDYKNTVSKLRPWIGLDYGPIVQSCPSTGLMEGAITNLTRSGDRGLVVDHGKFGNRFREISEANDRRVLLLKKPDSKWGQAFTPTEIKKTLKRYTQKNKERLTYLCIQQNETSSGVAYKQEHLASIVKAARAYNPDILIFVDTVSGGLAHKLDFKKLDVDIVILGSQKGLGCTSGLSFASVSKRAVKKMLTIAEFSGSWNNFIKSKKKNTHLELFESKQRVHYFSYLRMLIDQDNQTFSDTPSIFHIQSTLNSLSIAERMGHDMYVRRSQKNAAFTRKAASSVGARVLSRKPYQSSTVTPLILKSRSNAPEIKQNMEDQYGILIAGAQIPYWKKKMLRVGHAGHIADQDTVRCMRAMKILTKRQ